MKYGWMIVLLLAALGMSAAELECLVQPNPAVQGGVVEVTLRSDRARPEVTRRPAVDGGEWIGNAVRTGYSSHYSTSGGRQTVYSATLLLRVNRAGKIRIPAIGVSLNGGARQTEPVELTVLEAPPPDEDLAEGKLYFGRFLLPERRRFYVGEEIPFSIEYFTRQGANIQISYPRVTIPYAVFRDYRQENPENPRFAPPGRPRFEEIDGVRYLVQTVSGAFRPLAPGPIKPEATGDLAIVKSNGSRRNSLFDDDFFSPFGNARQVEQRQLVLASPGTVEVLPLPPLPAGKAVLPLGLVGDWQVHCRLDAGPVPRVGDVMTLRISLTGSGSGEDLTPPALTLEGFRVYPPELRRLAPGQLQLEYQLIPLRPGKTDIVLNPAVFDPVSGEYRLTGFSRQITVAEGEKTAAASDTVTAGAVGAVGAAEKPGTKGPDPGLHYLKLRSDGASWSRWPWIAALFIGGPVVWGVAGWLRRRRDRLTGDESAMRHRQAREQRNRLCRELMRCSAAELPGRVLNDVVPVLADFYGLPRGCTAAEVADRVDDPDLAERLRQYGLAAYRPGGSATPEIDRKPLVRALKKMLVLAVVLAAGAVRGEHFAAGNAAFDAGEFASAQKYFEAAVAGDPYNAAGFYNLGCAAFMGSDFPLALASFETARRYHPGDPDTIDNLNIARARLGLPPVEQVDSPAALAGWLRDQASPEDWLLLAAAVWFAGFILLIFRQRADRMTRVTVAAGWGVLLLLMLLAAWSSWSGPYARSRAVAASGGAEMRLLPTGNAPPEGTVPAGQEVRIREQRGDRVLIDWQGRTGWVEAGKLHRIFH